MILAFNTTTTAITTTTPTTTTTTTTTTVVAVATKHLSTFQGSINALFSTIYNYLCIDFKVPSLLLLKLVKTTIFAIR